ncbi:hypothetical protein WCLP8_5150012 [uncultured Gammaproteobacteria bacterium]
MGGNYPIGVHRYGGPPGPTRKTNRAPLTGVLAGVTRVATGTLVEFRIKLPLSAGGGLF